MVENKRKRAEGWINHSPHDIVFLSYWLQGGWLWPQAVICRQVAGTATAAAFGISVFFLSTEANVSGSAGTRQGGGTSGNIWKKTDILAFRLNAESSRYTMAVLAGMKCVSVWRLLNSLWFLSWKIHYSLALCQTVVERLYSRGWTRTFCLFLLLVWNPFLFSFLLWLYFKRAAETTHIPVSEANTNTHTSPSQSLICFQYQINSESTT